MFLNVIFIPESVSVANTGCNIMPTGHNKLKMSVIDYGVFSLVHTVYFRTATCNSFQLHVSCDLLNIGNSEHSDINVKTIFTFTKYCLEFL